MWPMGLFFYNMIVADGQSSVVGVIHVCIAVLCPAGSCRGPLGLHVCMAPHQITPVITFCSTVDFTR
jgi:hypothetical protein